MEYETIINNMGITEAFNGIGVPSSELPPEKARLLSLVCFFV